MADHDIFLVYYSIFIHYLLRLGQKYDGNIYIVLEALLKIPFIPSPSGWKKGIDMADESDLVQNFILCFIDEKRDNHGAVSSGTHTRRQVCHQKKVHITNLANERAFNVSSCVFGCGILGLLS